MWEFFTKQLRSGFPKLVKVVYLVVIKETWKEGSKNVGFGRSLV